MNGSSVRFSLVIVNATLHLRVGLDAPHEVACRTQQRLVQLSHRRQEGLGYRWPHQRLCVSKDTSNISELGAFTVCLMMPLFLVGSYELRVAPPDS